MALPNYGVRQSVPEVLSWTTTRLWCLQHMRYRSRMPCAGGTIDRGSGIFGDQTAHPGFLVWSWLACPCWGTFTDYLQQNINGTFRVKELTMLKGIFFETYESVVRWKGPLG